jgi:hypothetical protein
MTKLAAVFAFCLALAMAVEVQAQPQVSPTAQSIADEEAALRRLIEGMASGRPDYDQLSPAFAENVRSHLAAFQPALARLGPIQSVTFRGPGSDGDTFEVRFAKGVRIVSIKLTPAGKVDGAVFAYAEPAKSSAAALAGYPSEVPVLNTRRIDFVSKVNGRRYSIDVALPDVPPPAEGYPVIYVFDGYRYFAAMTEAVRANGNFSQAIVVGISYPRDPAQCVMRARAIILMGHRGRAPPIEQQPRAGQHIEEACGQEPALSRRDQA